MKVLMFGWEFPPCSTGGLGTHCYGLTKALSGQSTQVTFVMPKVGRSIGHGFVNVIQAGDMTLIEVDSAIEPYVASLDVSFVKSAEGGGAELYGKNLFSDVSRYTKLAVRAVKDIECDVIHCHDWMTFPAGVEVKKAKNKPLVVTVHSTEFDRNPVSPNSMITQAEWLGMYEADRIITVSEYMKRRLVEKYSVPPEKITVIYNAVEAGEYSGERIRFGLDEKVVLFLGRLTLQKGPDYFLSAAKRVLELEEKVRFVIVGTGNMLPQLIDQSIRLGISDKVTFTGYQDSIKEYYKMADLYVMPSVSEPFGIVALEAMASGVPVIISRQSGVSEVVSHCMKVDFWDVDEMANKIIGVLRYSSMRQEMRTNGAREVSRINWGDIARKTVEVYAMVRGG